MLHLVRAVLRDRKGVSAAEYAILAVAIVVAVGAAVANFGTSLTNAFATVGTTFESVQSSAQSGGASR